MTNRLTTCAALALASLVWGCASSSESASKDTLTENVGKYDSAPKGVNKPRVGVPAFSVKSAAGGGGGSEGDVDNLAADEMSTLLDNSDRVTVIERVQLQKLLDEQNMEGIVRPGEMAKTGQVRGVDFLLLGKVTNLRVKKENKERGFGLATIGGLINTGGADVKKTDTIITTECGVDIRLVNPTTGEVLLSNFSEYKKTDSVGAFGLKILGADADAKADIDVSDDDKGKILRLALDDAVRKSLPKLDKFLKSEKNVAAGTPAAAADNAAEPTRTPAVATQAPANASGAVKPAAAKPAVQLAKKFCPTCGSEVPAGSKFCPKDGTKID
ncbi:MAG: Curli production assembly/transport component CsgG [Phycisphaerales bacterium]|nr:Curli production assembly/transport component CsgG [Phycisphaerales bacterium]